MNYYVIVVLILLIYFNILYVSYVPKTDKFYVGFFDNVCAIINHYSSPEFIVARKYVQTPFTEYYQEFNRSSCYLSEAPGEWQIFYRPIFGDHIHLGYALKIKNKLITLRDHNMSHNVKYESNPPSCPNPPKYAYIKKWYHTGVHTHCDNIIHVHPFSAPRELRVEGKKVNLGIWFENVGIFYHPSTGNFEIPGHGQIQLIVAYYVHVSDPKPAIFLTDPLEILNLWLVDHQGFVAMWEKGDSPPDRSYKVLEYKKHPKNYPKRIVDMYD